MNKLIFCAADTVSMPNLKDPRNGRSFLKPVLDILNESVKGFEKNKPIPRREKEKIAERIRDAGYEFHWNQVGMWMYNMHQKQRKINLTSAPVVKPAAPAAPEVKPAAPAAPVVKPAAPAAPVVKPAAPATNISAQQMIQALVNLTEVLRALSRPAARPKPSSENLSYFI